METGIDFMARNEVNVHFEILLTRSFTSIYGMVTYETFITILRLPIDVRLLDGSNKFLIPVF